MKSLFSKKWPPGAVFITFCFVVTLHTQKFKKRPFPGNISKKVTSMTPLNIGKYMGIIEFQSKIGYVLLIEPIAPPF